MEGKRYQVWGKRKMFGEYAFSSDADNKFEELCNRHWKRSFFIVDTLKNITVAERHLHTFKGK